MRRLRLTSVTLAALVLAGCGNLLDPAAAVVNGTKITVDEVQAKVDAFKEKANFEKLSASGSTPEEITREFEQNLLTRFIRHAVLEPEAAKLGIEVSDADVAERMDQIKASFETEGQFSEELETQGLTIELLTDLVRDTELEERLRAEVTKDIVPSDEEILAYYEENLTDYTEFHTQHILVEENGLAIRLADRLRATSDNEIDDLFAELAREHSLDSGSQTNGGDLGYLPASQLVPEYVRAVEKLEEGEISNPVRTEFGYHVIRLVDRRQTPLPQVEESIIDTLTGEQSDEEWAQWLAGAYEEAGVEVNPRYGELDTETQTVTDLTPENIPAGATPQEIATPGPGAPDPAG